METQMTMFEQFDEDQKLTKLITPLITELNLLSVKKEEIKDQAIQLDLDFFN